MLRDLLIAVEFLATIFIGAMVCWGLFCVFILVCVPLSPV